jgi:two-component system, LuxR family, sensor kinase FixL
VVYQDSSWQRRVSIMVLAVVSTALFAWLDRHVHHNVPLGLVYLAPMALISMVTTRTEVVLAAALCTFVAEYSDAFTWNLTQGVARDALYFMAYAAEGLYITEMLSKRRAERSHVTALTDEIAARREAEEQLRLLVSCSSAAIITADQSGAIVQANQAALRLFSPDASEMTSLEGPLGKLLPALARFPAHRHPSKSLRSMLQCQGFRGNREPFVADVWFSTYDTPSGPRMTAVLADVSDDFRSREETNLEQILNSSRLIVGAMAHEMRNVCGAIGLVGENLLTRWPELAASEDFQALRHLTATLEGMTSIELSHLKRSAAPIRLQQILDDLRIIFGSSVGENAINISWGNARDTPLVWADQQSLLQVFLNLLRNTQAALRDTPEPCVTVSVHQCSSIIEVHVADNGPGVSAPDQLFRRFEAGSNRSGLGLYLSRAMLNSFNGDLRYQPNHPGACFIVELLIAGGPRP